jgi:hypothetical protein
MNAGEINIAVTASMAQFNATMTAVKQSAAATATSTGELLRNKLRDEFSEQKAGKMLGSVLGLGMADNVMRSMSAAIRGDKTLGAAVEELVRNLPVIGAAYDLGKAIGENLADGAFGTISSLEARMQRGIDLAFAYDREQEEKAFEESERKRKAAAAAVAKEDQARLKAKQDAEFEMMGQLRNRQIKRDQEVADFNLKVQVDAARKAGNEEEALRLEMEDAVAKARRELYEDPAMQAALFGSLGREEEDAARATIEDAEQVIRQQYEYRLYLHKQNIAEEEKDRLAMVEKESAARMEAAKIEIAALEQERLAAQTAGIGSAQTALGTFKFDAYPASKKLENDYRLIRGIEQIRDSLKDGVGGFN